MVLQMPRFGTTKLVDRIFINPSLNLTKLLDTTLRICEICGGNATTICRDCAGKTFGQDKRVFFYCKECSGLIHKHPDREKHKTKELALCSERTVEDNPENVQLDLFAVVCINTSHYVSFVKCGEGDQERWVFFDSMSDRQGLCTFNLFVCLGAANQILCFVEHFTFPFYVHTVYSTGRYTLMNLKFLCSFHSPFFTYRW